MTKLNTVLVQLEEGISFATLKSAYDEISRAYRAKKPIPLKSIEQQVAYLQVRMPATVAVIQVILEQLQPYKKDIKSLLDLGTGPGSVLWAAKSCLDLDSALLIDKQPGLMELGKRLGQHLGTGTQTSWVQSNLPTINLEAPLSPFQLVTASYVLNELSPSQQKTLIDNAWLISQQFLVLIEPGTPDGFMNIRNAREQLISKGAHIVAPCTHEKECPLSRDDWCHFVTRLERSNLHRTLKGELSYEDEKYSYLIASKTLLPNRSSARIVKYPKKSSGLVELDLCSDLGLQKIKVTKRQGSDYKTVRKLSWGDEFPF